MTNAISRGTAIALSTAALAFPAIVKAVPITTMTVAGVPEDSATPLLYALQAGIFRSYDLDVKIEPQRSGSAVAAGIAGGSYSIGKSSLTSIITAVSKGIPFVLVAAGGLYDTKVPTYGLIARADGGLRTGKDLNGKNVATASLNDLATVATRAWVDRAGGDSSTLKMLELPQSAVADAIEGGRVDAGPLNDPDLQHALARPALRLIGSPFDAIAPHFMYSAWFTSKAFAVANAAAVTAFAAAMRDAAVYTNAHPLQTLPLLAKFTSLDPAVISKMNRVIAGTTLDPRLIQPVIDATARYKIIPAAIDAKDLIRST